MTSKQGANIQISRSLFIDVYKLVFALQEYELDTDTQRLLNGVELQINTKLEAMEKRELYTQSKAAVSPSEREAARQKYLDRVGMLESFRWKSESEVGQVSNCQEQENINEP